MLTQILQKSFQLSNKEEYIDITHWIPKDMDLNRKVNHSGLVNIKVNMNHFHNIELAINASCNTEM